MFGFSLATDATMKFCLIKVHYSAGEHTLTSHLMWGRRMTAFLHPVHYWQQLLVCKVAKV